MCRRRWMLLIVFAVLIGACGQNPALEGEAAPDPVAPSPLPTASPSPSAVPVPVAQEPARPKFSELVLGPDGLGRVSFGDSREEVLSELEALLGPPDFTAPGCELAGPDLVDYRFKELTVTFTGDTFTDYGVRVNPDESQQLGLQTNHGIGLGSTLQELRAAYEAERLTIPGLPADMFGGLDFEISFPGTGRVLLGGLSGLADTSVVTSFFTSVCE